MLLLSLFALAVIASAVAGFLAGVKHAEKARAIKAAALLK